MDAIEQAIRNAFAKGDPEDPIFREKVYRWAYGVVEKAIKAKPGIAPEDADRQRRRALAAIKTVESEFEPATEPDGEAPAPEVAPAAARAESSVFPPAAPPSVPDVRLDTAPIPERTAPDIVVPDIASVDDARGDIAPVDIGPLESGRHEPPPVGAADDPAAQASAPEWPDLAEASDRGRSPRLAGDPAPADPQPAQAPVEEERPRRRTPWGLIVGLLIVAIIAVLAVWTAAELGFIRSSANDGGQPPPAAGENAGSPQAAQQPPLEDWIVVFSPNDPTSVTAPSGASADVAGEGDEQALRISSGSSGAAIVFDIGQGVLERLAGRRAIFDIVAQTGEGPETQMSVTCSLGELGECGRNRYQVGKERAEYLFEIEVPDRSPGSAGSIAIVSDVDNGGKAVEILEIRVTTAGD